MIDLAMFITYLVQRFLLRGHSLQDRLAVANAAIVLQAHDEGDSDRLSKALRDLANGVDAGLAEQSLRDRGHA